MPETQTQAMPDSATGFGALLASADGVTKPKAKKPEAEKVEPTMRALRRILGDVVLEIFPDGFPSQVDELYAVCAEKEDFWAEIQCETESERNDLLALMKAYAECASTKGYTVRQDRTVDVDVLRFRVVNRRGSVSDS